MKNIDIVSAIADLQQQLRFDAGFNDRHGMKMQGLANDERLKAAFNGTGGASKNVRGLMNAIATS